MWGFETEYECRCVKGKSDISVVFVWETFLTRLCEFQGNYLEVEVLLGEVVREGERCGIYVPTLQCLYRQCGVIQLRTIQKRQALV